MNDEQTRTLAYYEDRYIAEITRYARGHIKTTKDWHRYEQARIDFYGYRAWLDKYAIQSREVAA